MAEKRLGEFATPNNDYLHTPITQPTINAEDYEIKPYYLSLVQQNKFGGYAIEDAGMHLNTFTEICDMMCIKDVVPDAVKLRLFPFSLRGRAKEWLLSLPRNTIASWVECTTHDAIVFLGKDSNHYFPFSLRQKGNKHNLTMLGSISLMRIISYI